jgi:hypothetical protein
MEAAPQVSVIWASAESPDAAAESPAGLEPQSLLDAQLATVSGVRQLDGGQWALDAGGASRSTQRCSLTGTEIGTACPDLHAK